MRGQTLLSDRESCLFDTSLGFRAKKWSIRGSFQKSVNKKCGYQLREGESDAEPDTAARMMLSSSARCSPKRRFLMTLGITSG